MDISVIVNIALCILSFILAVISVVTVVVTLRQNSKMIENATRPYINQPFSTSLILRQKKSIAIILL